MRTFINHLTLASASLPLALAACVADEEKYCAAACSRALSCRLLGADRPLGAGEQECREACVLRDSVEREVLLECLGAAPADPCHDERSAACAASVQCFSEFFTALFVSPEDLWPPFTVRILPTDDVPADGASGDSLCEHVRCHPSKCSESPEDLLCDPASCTSSPALDPGFCAALGVSTWEFGVEDVERFERASQGKVACGISAPPQALSLVPGTQVPFAVLRGVWPDPPADGWPAHTAWGEALGFAAGDAFCVELRLSPAVILPEKTDVWFPLPTRSAAPEYAEVLRCLASGG